MRPAGWPHVSQRLMSGKPDAELKRARCGLHGVSRVAAWWGGGRVRSGTVPARPGCEPMRSGHVGAEPCGMDPIREVAVMTATVDLFSPQRLRRRWAAAGAAFGALVLLVAAVLVAAPEDVHTQAALRGYLDRAEGRMLLAWILSVLAGLAWLCLAVALRRLLPRGGGRDLFVAAVIAGQAAAWAGVSLGTAAAAPDAHQIPLSVFNALGEAAHLAGAAATAAMGLALLGLATAVRSAPAPLPRWFGWLTAGCRSGAHTGGGGWARQPAGDLVLAAHSRYAPVEEAAAHRRFGRCCRFSRTGVRSGGITSMGDRNGR